MTSALYDIAKKTLVATFYNHLIPECHFHISVLQHLVTAVQKLKWTCTDYKNQKIQIKHDRLENNATVC